MGSTSTPYNRSCIESGIVYTGSFKVQYLNKCFHERYQTNRKEARMWAIKYPYRQHRQGISLYYECVTLRQNRESYTKSGTDISRLAALLGDIVPLYWWVRRGQRNFEGRKCTQCVRGRLMFCVISGRRLGHHGTRIPNATGCRKVAESSTGSRYEWVGMACVHGVTLTELLHWRGRRAAGRVMQKGFGWVYGGYVGWMIGYFSHHHPSE